MEQSGTIGTWKRYKLGQAQFTKWLKQTSDRLGGSAKPASNRGPSSAVHWSELESMARLITDHAEPQDIPQSSISILRDVVASKSEDERLRKSNSSHEHIIKVLEKILAQLEATVSKFTGRTKSIALPTDLASDGQVSMDDNNNMFELLKVEETQYADDTASGESGAELTVEKSNKKRLGKNKGKKQKLKARKDPKSQGAVKMTSGSDWVDEFKWVDEEEDDEFDYYMLIYCFFEDFNTIRDYVIDKCCDYYFYKSVRTEVLGVITNAACELFHEMERELFKTARALKLPAKMVEYRFMMNTLFIQYGLDHVDYENDKFLSKDELQRKIHSEADWLGFMTYARLENILEYVPPGKVPMIPTDAVQHPMYGILDSEGMSEFTSQIIHEMMPDFCLLKALKVNHQAPSVIGAQDEVTLDFEEVLRARAYPSAMVLGLQLYVDIRYVMESETTRVFDQMQDSARNIEAALGRIYPALRSSPLKREMWGRIAEMDSVMLEDFMEEDKHRRWEEKGMEMDVEEHFLLKRHPIWAGLLNLRCKLVANNLGHRLMSSSTVVLAAAFAYEAARLAAPEGLSWSSMDRFIEYHGRNRVFQGSLPADISSSDLLKRFVDYDLATIKIGALVGFDIPSKTLEALYERYGTDTERSRRDMRYLQDIIKDKFNINSKGSISKLEALAFTDGYDEGNIIAATSTTVADEDMAPATAPEKIGDLLETQRVSPLKLLEILGNTTDDLLDHVFSVNYLAVYEESVQLLEILSKEFPDITETCRLPAIDDPTFVEKLAKLTVGISNAVSKSDGDNYTKKLVQGTKMFLSGLPE
ncbi:hypothetical protein SCUP234_10181 [Seiridium cupressi]